MDGTLITNTNSVKYLCKINDNLDEVLKIEQKEKTTHCHGLKLIIKKQS